MRRAAVVGVLLILAAGCDDPATETLRPGTKAVVVPWKKDGRKMISSATFFDEAGPMAFVPTGTDVEVADPKPGPASGDNNAMERVRVKVKSGPLDGHVGQIVRPHLRRVGAE